MPTPSARASLRRMIRALTVVGMSAAIALSASCAPGVTAAPSSWPTMADVTASTAFDPAGIAALNARMEEAVNRGEVSGLAHMLVKNGQVVNFRDVR